MVGSISTREGSGGQPPVHRVPSEFVSHPKNFPAHWPSADRRNRMVFVQKNKLDRLLFSRHRHE